MEMAIFFGLIAVFGVIAKVCGGLSSGSNGPRAQGIGGDNIRVGSIVGVDAAGPCESAEGAVMVTNPVTGFAQMKGAGTDVAGNATGFFS